MLPDLVTEQSFLEETLLMPSTADFNAQEQGLASLPRLPSPVSNNPHGVSPKYHKKNKSKHTQGIRESHIQS